MSRYVSIALLLVVMIFVITGVAVADDPPPRVVSAWEDSLPYAPIYPDHVAEVRQTIDTTAFSPQAIDAVGLTYLPASNRLLLADSEVEETAYYQGVNLWEVSLQGAVQWTGTTVPRTYEAVGLSVNAFNNHLFVVSDTDRKIFEIAAGADGKYFTVDDVTSVFSTNPLPTLPDDLDANDPEGIAYNPWRGTLYIIEDKPGESSVLIELSPGPNGVFDGVAPEGDDVTTHLVLDDVDPAPGTPVQIRGAEDIAFNYNSGTLYVSDTRANFILEIKVPADLEGAEPPELVRRIQINSLDPAVPKNVVRSDGLVYAPSSSNPAVYSLYVADRGVDEQPDGRIVEFSLPSPTIGNNPPSVNAGADQTIQLPNTAALSGSVTDDGVPAQFAVRSFWRMVSGPASVTFADNTSPVTTATFTAPGTYILRLTASDFELSNYDEITITVQSDPDNAQPTVNAGPDQTVQFPGPATLNGSASDDGKPGPLTTTWSRTSGPGIVTFANRNALQTTATFSEPGTYVLRLTADDGELTAYDELTVTVTPGELGPYKVYLPIILNN